MKRLLIGFIIGFVVGGTGGYAVFQKKLENVSKDKDVKEVVKTTEKLSEKIVALFD